MHCLCLSGVCGYMCISITNNWKTNELFSNESRYERRRVILKSNLKVTLHIKVDYPCGVTF